MISRKFLSSSIIYSGIGSLPLASSFILLPFYTNYLSTSDYGLLALYLSISLLVQILVNFALDTTIGIHYFEFRDDQAKLRSFIGTIAGLLLVVGLLFALLSAGIGNIFFSKIFPNNDLKFYPYGFLAVLTGIFNSYFKTYINLLINQERPARYFWMNITIFALTIILTLAGLYFYPHSLIGPLGARFVAGLLIFVATIFFFKTEFDISIKVSFLKGLFVFCLPVFLYFIIAWILSFADRFIIKAYMEASDVGIYDFIVKCTLIIDFVLNGLSSAITPKVYKILKEMKLNESTVEMNRYFNGFTIVTLFMVPLLVLIIPVVIPLIVTRKDYYAGFPFVGILCLGFLARALHLMYLIPIYYFKKTARLPVILFLSATLQIGFTIMGIKEFGLMGAVWANFLSRPIQVLFLFLFSRNIFQFRFNKSKLIYLPLFYIILNLFCYFIFRNEHLVFVSLCQLIIVYAAVVVVFRKEIPVFVGEVKRSSYFS